MIIQGREITYRDIESIRQMIAVNPTWNRTRLSRELCVLWKWRAPNGQLKDMACRALLLKMEQGGHIILPARNPFSGKGRVIVPIPFVPHKTVAIVGELKTVTPLRIETVEDNGLLGLFKCLLSQYHYLSFGGTVGENMKYLVFARDNSPVACLLFGSAAWKSAPRDTFIGWDARTRKANLNFLTNNTRFLILPWVKVPHLASHILGIITRRISSDWMEKYGHPVYLLETFVERERFRGVCYRAATWFCVGQTTGRSRNDRYFTLKVPVKDIYLYPLAKNFQGVLKHEA